MMDSKPRRLALAAVPNATPDVGPFVSFCSHCGERHAIGTTATRVCPGCGLGLLLQSRSEVAPAPDAPFLVIDDTLSVCAVSAAAERLLATDETQAVNRHLTQLLVPADAEAQTARNLAVAVTWAARGAEETRRVVVRPANTFGVRLAARIVSCGPPIAALIVFD